MAKSNWMSFKIESSGSINENYPKLSAPPAPVAQSFIILLPSYDIIKVFCCLWENEGLMVSWGWEAMKISFGCKFISEKVD